MDICLTHHPGTGNPQTFSPGVLWVSPLGLERDSLPHLLHVQRPPTPTNHLHGAGSSWTAARPTESKDLPPASHSRFTQPDLHLSLPFNVQSTKTHTDKLEAFRRVQPYQGSAQNPAHGTGTVNTLSHTPSHLSSDRALTPFTGPPFELFTRFWWTATPSEHRKRPLFTISGTTYTP